jgi:molecular chaperone GrpE
MELIQRQLREVLCKHGLEEYSCLGAEFDPRKAEAIGFVHSAEHAPNTVVDEACKGYSCGGKVLRPAKVLVARAKAGNEQGAEPAKNADGEIPEAADESNE